MPPHPDFADGYWLVRRSSVGKPLGTLSAPEFGEGKQLSYEFDICYELSADYQRKTGRKWSKGITPWKGTDAHSRLDLKVSLQDKKDPQKTVTTSCSHLVACCLLKADRGVHGRREYLVMAMQIFSTGAELHNELLKRLQGSGCDVSGIEPVGGGGEGAPPPSKKARCEPEAPQGVADAAQWQQEEPRVVGGEGAPPPSKKDRCEPEAPQRVADAAQPQQEEPRVVVCSCRDMRLPGEILDQSKSLLCSWHALTTCASSVLFAKYGLFLEPQRILDRIFDSGFCGPTNPGTASACLGELRLDKVGASIGSR